ncbi:MAG TPA: pitrilysin family protein [Allosphingosinicella sp.]|nr:pitrilysin family protein [Allosphingosinicella sp.]
MRCRGIAAGIKALAALLILAGVPASGQQPDEVRAAWGFDRTDLVPHPEVRFGLLPNGMRYALMPSEVPAGALSVRLRIGAGSSAEGEREEGHMHLIEHLIFEGSRSLPKGALPFMLGREGLRQLSDFNAYTSFSETVYRLDLGKSDARARETALNLVREISTNLLFDRRTIAGAKEMVLAEIGERDAVQDRIMAAQNAFFFPGSEINRGSVPGTRASIGRAKAEALERLYHRHYVPQRATLVLVGDFDPAAVEREIAARFSDWQQGEEVAPPPIRQTSATPSPRGIEAAFFFHSNAPTTVTIASVASADLADVARRRDAQFLEHLASGMLTRRLARIAARADAAFAAGDSAIYNHFGAGRLSRIELAAKDRDWAAALRAGQAELSRTLDGGFSQGELDEQLAVSRRALERQSGPRTSPALADAIVDAVGRGIVFTEPGDNSATEAYLARVRLEEVNAAFRGAWADPSRLIFVSHNRRVRNAEEAIKAAYSPGR